MGFEQSHFIFFTWPRLLFLFLRLPSFSYGAVTQSPTQPIHLQDSQRFNPDPSTVLIAASLIFVFLVLGAASILSRQCFQPVVSEQHPPAAAATRDWACSCSQGIEKEIIDTFPILVYSSIKDLKIGKGALECAVCLTEFDDMDTLRLLPKCNHVFHPECIDAWLVSHVTCPVCRANLKSDAGVVQISMPTQLNDDVLDQESGSSGDEIRETEQQTEVSNVNEEQRILISEDEPAVRQNRSPKSRKFSKFSKSNSTGHSLILPGANMDRYTLRLHEDLMTHILQNHGIVAGSASQHVSGNPKKGIFWSGTDGSSRGASNDIEGSSRGKRDYIEGSKRGKRDCIEGSSRCNRGYNQRQERRVFSTNPSFVSLSPRWESAVEISSSTRFEK